MDTDFPKGFTAVIGEKQGWRPLPVRIENMAVEGLAKPVLTVTSAWRPSPEEIEQLRGGAVIEVFVLGAQPPMAVTIAEGETRQ